MQRGDDKAGFEKSWNFPFLEALTQRRARRIMLGGELDSPFKFKSQKEPVPLTKRETALLCFAAAGQTGYVMSGDTPLNLGGDCNLHWTGRTIPSACNNQQTSLLFTNDDGVFFYKPRKAQKPVEIQSMQDLEKRLDEFDQDVIKLQDGRLNIPQGPPALFNSLKHVANRPGQTLFMPVVDITFELINGALHWANHEKYSIIDHQTGKPAGTEKWVDKLKLTTKVPLNFLEQKVLCSSVLEIGFMAQNLLLMAESMGIGAFPFGGFVDVVAMGATPITRGLGFRWITDKKGNLNPIGIDGIMEAHCPPYFKDMGAAVDDIVNHKYGPDGVYSVAEGKTPQFLEKNVASRAEPVPEDVIQCVKDYCNYVYNNYGRFPATVNTMGMFLWVGAHHLDLDYYKKFYVPEMINKNHHEHMKDWHGIE